MGKSVEKFKFISELYIIFDKEFGSVPKFLCKKAIFGEQDKDFLHNFVNAKQLFAI